ncbi:MAG: DUF362 domain-containing protein [Planctomycetes bacterium]|nr:DUF362 domain-containing protein [Planctomycetota bacterium]
MAHRLPRRTFLTTAGAAALGAAGMAALPGCGGGGNADATYRARAHPQAEAWKNRIGLAQGGDDPARNVQTAIENLCGKDGVRTFVRQGDIVVVKPNIGWAQVPEMGATVDPTVVATVVRLCREAGAATVKVFDNSVGTDAKCYQFSGIEEAAREAGADVFLCQRHRFRTVTFADPRCKRLKEWPIYDDVLTCDVLVNVAVAKTHNLCYVTLCMKNLMGTQGGDRGKMHQEIHQNLADLNVTITPTFNILDATRVMIDGGPGGGRKDQVVRADTIVCGTSSTTIDCWAADPAHLPWPKGHHDLKAVEMVARGAEAGLGTADPAKIEVAA